MFEKGQPGQPSESVAHRGAHWTLILREFECITYKSETENPPWWTRRRISAWFRRLPVDSGWNLLLSVCILIGIIFTSRQSKNTVNLSLGYFSLDLLLSIISLDLAINVIYGITIVAFVYDDYHKYKHEEVRFTYNHYACYIIDLLSFAHVFVPQARISRDNKELGLKSSCYYMRLHRPFRYFWSRNDNNLKGSVFRAVTKFFFLYIVMRTVYADIFIMIGEIHNAEYHDNPEVFKEMSDFHRAFYVVTKLCIPVGPDTPPTNDLSRSLYVAVMISGCLIMKAITVASLSLIIALHLRPGDVFRERFKLINKEMMNTNIPAPLREKVETFYMMYWHKQKAVSVTQLLPTFPPTLSYTIYTDIYFEAQQKSRILRDLSYQFLSELAKVMKTINYVPGDIIVKRNSVKSSIIFITHGDVEVLTAEDDETAILRFTRGSIINSCGGCVEVAGSRSHVAVRAATFCTAHVLTVADLWRVALKHGRTSGQTYIILASFRLHLNRVKRHSNEREHPPVKYKSNIVHMKRNVIALKETRNSEGALILKQTDVFIQIAGCYLMRNQEDSSLMEEGDAICLRPTFPCILQPISSLQTAWNLLVALFTLVVTILYPYTLMFVKTISVDFMLFDLMVFGIYILDIAVHLSTGSKTEEGIALTFSQTASHQLDKWFTLDVFSVLSIIAFFSGGERFNCINRLFKIPKLFHVIDDIFYQTVLVRFLLFCLLFLLLPWLVAAVDQWYRCFVLDYCLVTNITNEPFWPKKPLDDSPAGERVLFTYYWAISMMTFTTQKNQQSAKNEWWSQLFIMLVLELCVWLHNLMEAGYSANIMTTESMSDEYNTCIETVKNFLVKNQINPQLRSRFINYLQLSWYTDRAYSITHKSTSILFDLPEHVNQSILSLQRSKFVLCIPFTKVHYINLHCLLSQFFNQEELKLVSSNARLFYTSPNEILLNTGDISNEVYVIKQGYCEVLDPITKEQVSLIGTRKYFGDLECLLRFPAYYTVRAVTHVQVFCISRKHLLQAIATPKIKDAINFTKQRPEFEALKSGYKPFLRYEQPAPAPSREWFPRVRKHERDEAFLEPFYSIGFFSVLRYVFPRFTLRPDGPYLRRTELLRAGCAFVSAIVFPVYTFLQLQWPGLWYLATLLDISAYFDICQRMLVAYFDSNGILVYHPASTAAHYIKSAFVIDLFSCLPLEYLDNARDNIYMQDNAYKHPSTMQVFMYNRLGQLYRLPHALGMLKRFTDREDIILVIKGIPIFTAMIMVATSMLLEYSVEKWTPVSGGWRLTTVVDPKYGSWIERHTDVVRYNITATPFNAVLTTYFWIVFEVTTTGFNVFQPSNFDQMIVIIVSMTVGSIIVAYLSVHLISIRSNVNRALATFQEDMKDMTVFMTREKIDHDLQRKVKSYYEYKWEKMGGTDFRTVLKLCDQITLRKDTILQLYGDTFSDCPIFRQCEVGLLRLIGRAVTSRYFRENTTIVELDDVVSYMYFIKFGLVVVSGAKNEPVAKLGRGSIFGNLDNAKALCRYRFVTSCNGCLLKISTDTFYKIIYDFPSVKVILKKYQLQEGYIADDAQKRNSSKIKIVSNPIIEVKRRLNYFLNKYYSLVNLYLVSICLLTIYGEVYNAGFLVNNLVAILTLYFLDFLFVIKIFVNYFEPIVTDEEREQENIILVNRKKYLRGQFKYDVISCLPLEMFCLLARKRWNAFAYWRFNRSFRLVQLYRSLKWFQQKFSINMTVTTSVAVLIWFILFVHSVACFWFAMSEFEEEDVPFSSWRYTNDKKSVCSKSTYICSMYFVLTTFTQNGVGDILPRQQAEVMFVCLLMMSSTMIFLIYIGEFSNMIQFQAYRWFTFYSKYMELQAFLKNNRVSRNLAKITKKYTLHVWREGRGLQEPQFLVTAPHCLRLEVMAAAYMHHLLAHPVFQECEPAFLRLLVGYFNPFTYTEDMYVVKQGEITNSMYFVHRGRIEQLAEDLSIQLEEFKTGQHFGTVHGLNFDIEYDVSYKTVINSQVITLCYSDWEHLLDIFPKSKAIVLKTRDDDMDDDFKDKTIDKITAHIENLPELAGVDLPQISSVELVKKESSVTLPTSLDQKTPSSPILTQSSTQEAASKSLTGEVIDKLKTIFYPEKNLNKLNDEESDGKAIVRDSIGNIESELINVESVLRFEDDIGPNALVLYKPLVSERKHLSEDNGTKVEKFSSDMRDVIIPLTEEDSGEDYEVKIVQAEINLRELASKLGYSEFELSEDSVVTLRDHHIVEDMSQNKMLQSSNKTLTNVVIDEIEVKSQAEEKKDKPETTNTDVDKIGKENIVEDAVPLSALVTPVDLILGPNLDDSFEDLLVKPLPQPVSLASLESFSTKESSVVSTDITKSAESLEAALEKSKKKKEKKKKTSDEPKKKLRTRHVQRTDLLSSSSSIAVAPGKKRKQKLELPARPQDDQDWTWEPGPADSLSQRVSHSSQANAKSSSDPSLKTRLD